MCEFNTKITIAQLLRLTIVSAKKNIYSPRRGYLSPSGSIVLEIATALLFIASQVFADFGAHFQNRTVYFCHLCTRCGPIGTTGTLTLLRPGDIE